MTADYLTEALRACRLPISMAYNHAESRFHIRGRMGFSELFLTCIGATRGYTALRDRLLRQEEDNQS